MKRMKQMLTMFLGLALVCGLWAAPAAAKTVAAEQAQTVFFYVKNQAGKSVLLKAMPISELKTLAHGDTDGENYAVSATDNYPTTQYCEGRGFTVSELVDYVKSVSAVKGAAQIAYAGSDTMKFMATDSFGNYSRSWTYDALYGVKRYYFEGLYDKDKGWKTGWEITGEDSSKYGVTLEEYNSTYKDKDAYYADKQAAFAGGVETQAILATESYSGRTTAETLASSSEPGIAAYIEQNGGLVKGCLKNVLTEEYALRLTLPMTEADLMAAHRTAYDNFKWVYNLRLEMASAPAISSLGTVAEPVPTFTRSGDRLTVSFSCATSGASIYYGDNGAAQILYTGPITYDIAGRDLETDPVTLYATAVKEGYDDGGTLTYKYPGMAPAFQTVYSGMTGGALTFTAAAGVSSADWTAWSSALNFISLKTPSVNGYVTVEPSLYTLNPADKTITFDSSLFATSGSYSFVFHATKYANKNVSVTMKQAAPALPETLEASLGQALTLPFADGDYQKSLSVYVTGEQTARTMISASYLDRSQAGQVTIKADYFAAAGSAMKNPGVYTLELNNNNYSPASQTVTVTLNKTFPDVPKDAWYAVYVTDLVNRSVINGMDDGTFSPEGTVTWGQALKLLLRAVGYEEQAATGTHWASGYLDQAVADGLTEYSGDLYGPITRMEFCQIAARALKAETTLTESPFPDTDDPAVLALYELKIINGMGDGSFSPNSTLTRSQISKIIWCINNLKGDHA